ncbi:MAG TPA: penicillin-binding transpeptidase domain-containing protein [Oligoflexus sp.]|uniref:penicillin-binding transpeptidase domain-containing protein n=1 Tax=Oligoflexus sp. TaxID=1971216 RepID=UPI002D4C3E6E|nr:penicillin-binding transpeptidase domain-containing protein [Oligoflexus sp.]HYX33654.1 penicillin-binding transpeptidase domain-containing protein [Oligoflexus sp.]
MRFPSRPLVLWAAVFHLTLPTVFAANEPAPSPTPASFPPALAATDACFVLYDLKENRVKETINPERCKQRHAACSTFKVPLAVMSFDAGILKDKSSSLKWDGKKRMVPEWNKDQTAQSWMTESVVWFSQHLTRQLGRPRIQSYLSKFGYGSADYSGGLEDAWLTPAPFLTTDPKTSLTISGLEQIEFLKALYKNELPASKDAMHKARKLLPSETSPGGTVLSGKTGSGFIGEDFRLRLGWFVAHIKRPDGHEFLAVLTYNDRTPIVDASFGGGLAKDSMKGMLAERGLW